MVTSNLFIQTHENTKEHTHTHTHTHTILTNHSCRKKGLLFACTVQLPAECASIFASTGFLLTLSHRVTSAVGNHPAYKGQDLPLLAHLKVLLVQLTHLQVKQHYRNIDCPQIELCHKKHCTNIML